MKKILCLLLPLWAACSSPTPSSTEPQPAAFRIALLSPGPISDAGWNAAAYEGLMKAKSDLGAEVAQVQVKTPSEFEEAFRDFAAKGFNIVWGHGFEFQEAAAKVAPEFPNTVFLTSGGNTVLPNMGALNFQYEEVAYLQGVLAARLSKSGKLAMVGGMEIPTVKASYEAFKRGALSVRPDAQVLVSYIGGWEDVSAAKEAALAMVNQGVDGLFQNCDAAGLGVFQAAREKQVRAYGTASDQSAAAPDVVVSSSAMDIPAAFVLVAKSVKEGKFKGARLDLGFLQGVASHILNPALQSQIPPEVLTELSGVEQQLKDGKIQMQRMF